jgi:hypothetical protein
MRLLLMVLLAAGLCIAFNVQPTYNGVKDSGSQNLPTMNVGITIDCGTKELTVTVKSNDTGEPVAGARTYLFYTNYAYQAIANGQTGEDGIAVMNVVGNMDYLTSMFVLHTEQPQFRTREIEFTYEKCFGTPPAPPPVNLTNQTLNSSNVTQPQNVTPPANQTPAKNVTPAGNVTPRQNDTAPIAQPKQPASSLPCLPALLLAVLLSARRYA